MNRRSFALALVVVLVGLAFYVFDNHLKDPVAEGSTLKVSLQVIELVIMIPGLGLLVYSWHEGLRRRERQAVADERGRRFAMLGRIAASVAHEIRNPLHNLRLIGEALERDPEPRHRALVARLESNLARLDQAIALVYELARPNRQADGLAREAVDLVPLLTAVIEALPGRRPVLDLRGPAPPRVGGREASLRIAFGNLLRNAIEAAGEHGAAVRLERDGDLVLVTISNPGAFPEEVLRGDHAHESEKPQGMGVGLGIARHLLERLGGRLELRNIEGLAVATVTVGIWKEEADDEPIDPGR